MAYCSKCGTKLSNTAKYCPVCGNAIGASRNNVSPNSMKRQIDDDDSLSTWEKIALGIAGLIAFIGLCGGFADGMWAVGLLSLCALGAVCAVFMGTIEKKYAWATAIVSVLAVFFAIGVSPKGNDEVAKAAREEHFYELLPDDGSTTFIVEDCKPIGSDGLVIKSIEFFEKNGTRDFRLDGYLKNGKNVVLEGKFLR